MEGLNRKPFQGVINIIRFNWHFYVLAFLGIVCLIFLQRFISENLNPFITLFIFLTGISISLSLAASYYIYDLSNLYSLNWLDKLTIRSGSKLVNINAGFDETSALLENKFPDSTLTVFDFYDPTKHTEVSIERARKAYPAFPGTKTIETSVIPLDKNSVDYIFLVLSAHEIRQPAERVIFFKQLNNLLKPEGKIVVIEHQRDLANFVVYNFGFFHFFSGKIWRQAFNEAELSFVEEFKITPFISTFILQKNGTTS